MQILVVNAGSSTLKLSLFTGQSDRLICVVAEQYAINDEDPVKCVGRFTCSHIKGTLDAVVHRIVHGGTKLGEPCIIDDGVEQTIAGLQTLAPLHNPVALKWMRACRQALGGQVPQIAIFDTAFYRDLPAVAQGYALPQRWINKHSIRRFGFHGIAHQVMWQRWCKLNPDAQERGRIISLQLGSGCSITAVRDGKPLDTSMGFSPLEGLVMATRAGDLDPGLLLYLQEQENLSPQAMQQVLNQHSGLLGLSGISGDMRALLASTDTQARFAIDLYCYRIRKYIGAYLAVLGGADAILFGGGVGENAPVIREKILWNMQWSGIELDNISNQMAMGKEACISTRQSLAAVWVIKLDEAAAMARQAATLVVKS